MLVTDSVVNNDGVTPGSGLNGTITEAEYDDLVQIFELATPLGNVLGVIALPQISCAFAIPPTADGRAIDPNGVTITFTLAGEPPQIFTRSLDDCSTGDWNFSQFDSNAQPTEIQFCPNRCEAFVESEGATVRFVFTCL